MYGSIEMVGRFRAEKPLPLSLTAISTKSCVTDRQMPSRRPSAVRVHPKHRYLPSHFQYVGERGEDQAPSKNREIGSLGNCLKIDVRATNPHQEDRLTHAVGEVVPRRACLGIRANDEHRQRWRLMSSTCRKAPCPYIGRICPCLRRCACVGRFSRSAESLNRRQRVRISCAMRRATSAHGSGPLSGHEVADVIKRDDAGAIIASGASGDPDIETVAAVAQHGRLPLMKPQSE